LAEFLLEKGIVCEFSDPDFLVLMLTPENDGVFEKLLNVLEKLPRLKEIGESARVPESCQRVLSVREAMLSPSEEIDVDEARGRILASPSVSCPPAVPILVCGEMIDEKAIECFKYYGIEKCRVVELNKSKSATV
jgi:arginine/lysine/ornithine decarboxylase